MSNDSLAAIALAEAWAARNVLWLQAILDRPGDDHDALTIQPKGGLLVAHVVGLVGQLSKRPGGPWKRYYEGRLKGGQYVALHTWLYHLGGGSEAKLCAPDGSANRSRDLVLRIEREAIHQAGLQSNGEQKTTTMLRQKTRGISRAILTCEERILTCEACATGREVTGERWQVTMAERWQKKDGDKQQRGAGRK